MQLENINSMITASVDEVTYLSKLKNNMSDTEYNNLIFETLNKFISDKEDIKKLIYFGIFTWEVSVILQMQNQEWFCNGLTFLSKELQNLINKDKKKALLLTEEHYPAIHEALACWTDTFLLNDLQSKRPRLIVREYFRVIGDTIESVHYVFINYIHSMLVNIKDSKIFGKLENVSNGQKVSDLINISQFKELYQDNLLGISLNQWRNISNHSSYRYESSSNLIICKYGKNNSKKIKLTLIELHNLMVSLNNLHSFHKISVDFFIAEHCKDINFQDMDNVEISLETIIGYIGNSIGELGYKVINVEQLENIVIFKIEDVNSKGETYIKENSFSINIYLYQLKERGFNPKLELYSVDGIKLSEAYFSN